MEIFLKKNIYIYMSVYMYITESLCYTSKTLYINYISKKNRNRFKYIENNLVVTSEERQVGKRQDMGLRGANYHV